jgi:glutamate--cysteine ligase
VLALPALIKGLLYEPDCQEAASDFVKRWTIDQCRELYGDVTRGGLAARLRGIRVGELARELLEIATQGLKRQAANDEQGRDERQYLEPVIEQVESGRTLADDIVRRWTGPWERRDAALAEGSAIRA